MISSISCIRAEILWALIGTAFCCVLACRVYGDAPLATPAGAGSDAIATAKSANGNFAADLYRQLAQDRRIRICFFLPHLYRQL